MMHGQANIKFRSMYLTQVTFNVYSYKRGVEMEERGAKPERRDNVDVMC